MAPALLGPGDLGTWGVPQSYRLTGRWGVCLALQPQGSQSQLVGGTRKSRRTAFTECGLGFSSSFLESGYLGSLLQMYRQTLHRGFVNSSEATKTGKGCYRGMA